MQKLPAVFVFVFDLDTPSEMALFPKAWKFSSSYTHIKHRLNLIEHQSSFVIDISKSRQSLCPLINQIQLSKW